MHALEYLFGSVDHWEMCMFILIHADIKLFAFVLLPNVLFLLACTHLPLKKVNTISNITTNPG